MPLLSPTRTPGKITLSKLEITFVDRTSTVIYSKRQLARKTIARRAPKTRGKLKPQWNIIENDTISNYSLHTITLDADDRKNTVLRKNNQAIVTQTLPTHQKQASPPKRLINMVACKSLREYKRNQEKIKQLCLEVKKRAQQKEQSLIQGPSSSKTTIPSGEQDHYNHEKLVTIAKNNQKQQQQRRCTKQKHKVNTDMQQLKQQLSPQRMKKQKMLQKEVKSKPRWKKETNAKT